jgi:uncharacterized protein (TIGR00730 family)
MDGRTGAAGGVMSGSRSVPDAAGHRSVSRRAICVFCGSSPGSEPIYLETAQAMGRAIARSSRRLVYGGSNIGLMAALATAALDAGGEVVGVIPSGLEEKKLGHTGLTALHVTGSMHERKAMMAELSDGFIAMPGGLGTLDELFEIWSWAQLGLHAKPIGLLNVRGFFDPLLAFMDRVVEERFMRREHRDALIVESGPERLLERMEGCNPVDVSKWVADLRFGQR